MRVEHKLKKHIETLSQNFGGFDGFTAVNLSSEANHDSLSNQIKKIFLDVVNHQLKLLSEEPGFLGRTRNIEIKHDTERSQDLVSGKVVMSRQHANNVIAELSSMGFETAYEEKEIAIDAEQVMLTVKYFFEE